jgi:hypothetical protein
MQKAVQRRADPGNGPVTMTIYLAGAESFNGPALVQHIQTSIIKQCSNKTYRNVG